MGGNNIGITDICHTNLIEGEPLPQTPKRRNQSSPFLFQIKEEQMRGIK